MAAIPFDSLVLWAVVNEAQHIIGEHINRVWSPDDTTCVLKFGRGAQQERLLFSCDPRFFRVHFCGEKPEHSETSFGRILRDKVDGARVTSFRQVAFDRACELVLAKGDVRFTLRAELYGTRSNLLLMQNGMIVARARRVQSATVNAPESLDDAFQQRKGISPFLVKEIDLIGADGLTKKLDEHRPAYVEGAGAYPYAPEQLRDQHPFITATMSAALEMHYSKAVPLALRDAKAQTLRSQLTRALDAKRSALRQIDAVLDVASRSRQLQMQAELLLAHASQMAEGTSLLETNDYDGNPLAIRVDPESGPLATAEKLFQKAKGAKAAATEASPRASSMREEALLIESALSKLDALDLVEVEGVEQSAKASGWLREAVAPIAKKEDRPFAGHRIREATSPAGYRVLYGENATSNDYLTTRVAKPNDLWFHARGAHGSHVVLQTNNNPERVQRADIEFAAKLAARHSGQKHASNVPVSYTLAKYVRKPRKAAPGAVTMANEKVVFV